MGQGMRILRTKIYFIHLSGKLKLSSDRRARPTSLFTQLLSSLQSLNPFFMVFYVHRNRLIGMGEEWDGERKPRPTSLFTRLLSSEVIATVVQCLGITWDFTLLSLEGRS